VHRCFFFLILTIILLDLIFSKKFPKIVFTVYLLSVAIFYSILNMEFNTSNAVEFISLYFIEFVLSIDNIFVFLIILPCFKVNEVQRNIILNVGIIFAIFIRTGIINYGMKIINTPYIMEIFGILLLITAIKTIKNKPHGVIDKILSILRKHHINSSFMKILIGCLCVGFVDIMFAIDSIPVALSLSANKSLIIFANIFAVIGMKNISIILSNIIEKFIYLKYGIGLILIFIAGKLIFHNIIHISILISLVFCFTSISIAIFASLYKKKNIDI